MRYPFSSEAEFNFSDEWELPSGIFFTDIDGMLRGRRVLVAVVLSALIVWQWGRGVEYAV